MIAWSIEAARDSALFEHITVSTDDAEIAEIARQWGADVPFVRPAELAGDHATIPDVMAHAARWWLEQAPSVSAFCCISATAPFLRPADLIHGAQAHGAGGWAYAFTATEFAAPIFRSFRVHPEGGVEMFFPEHYTQRSQDLPVALHDAGQFYWGRPDAWLARTPIFARTSFPVVVPRWRVQDIDTIDDWIRAETMVRAVQEHS